MNVRYVEHENEANEEKCVYTSSMHTLSGFEWITGDIISKPTYNIR